MSEYWVHLEGVNQIRRQWGNEQPSELSIRRLLTISSFLKVLSDTTSVDLSPIPWSENTVFYKLPSEFLDNSFGLEFTYGITPTLANYLYQTTILAQHTSYFVSKDLPIPLSLLSTCFRFSTMLSSWSLDAEDLSCISGADPTTLQLARIHILAFAQSLRIYYHTRVVPCTSSQLALYVEHTAQHLTEIESIKGRRVGLIADSAASITWSGFIASCEAELGHRDIWHRWWVSMLRYRIGNIAHLWAVVQGSWALRDAGLREVPAWMPLLRQTGQRVLAV